MAPKYRLLGTLGMIGSPFLFLSFAADGFARDRVTRLDSALGLVFAIGWLSAVLGLWSLRATGMRPGGRIVLGVELMGVVLACLCNVYQTIDPSADTIFLHITDAAWPLSMLMLIVTGIVVIFARRLRGRARFVPLICGLWFPISGLLGSITGVTAGLIFAGIYTTIAWLSLGYIIYTGRDVTARE
jgi:hypothetical protein